MRKHGRFCTSNLLANLVHINIFHNRTLTFFFFSFFFSFCLSLFPFFLPRTALHSLDLSGNPIKDTGALALAMALTEMEGLSVLKLDKTEIGKDGAAAISKACAVSSTTLRMLTVGHNAIGPEGAMSIMALLSNSTNVIEVLDMSSTGCYCSDVLAALGETNCQSLVEFRIGGNKFASKKALNVKEGYKPPPALARFTKSATVLQLLDVSGTAIPLPALESIMVAVQKIPSGGGAGGFALRAARCDLGQSQQAMGLLAGTAVSRIMVENGEAEPLASPPL